MTQAIDQKKENADVSSEVPVVESAPTEADQETKAEAFESDTDSSQQAEVPGQQEETAPGSIKPNTKAEGLDFYEQTTLVRAQFRRDYPEYFDYDSDDPIMLGNIVSVYDDSVILTWGDPPQYARVGYTVDSQLNVSFTPREDWQLVAPRQEWVIKTRELRKLEMPEVSPCGLKAIKVIDEASRRFGLYVTVWGERDCQDDRMTKTAVSRYVPLFVPLMLWKHGLDPEFGSEPVGKWDPSSFRLDEVGWYAEGTFNDSPLGHLAWVRCKDSGSVGASLGSIWYLVKKVKLSDGTKDIVDWPPLEISVMEGAKQCVPSAQSTIKSNLFYQLKGNIDAAELDVPNELIEDLTSGGTIMSDPIVDENLVADLVAKQLAGIRAQEAEAKQQEAARQKAILEAAKEHLNAELPTIREEIREEEKATLVAELVPTLTADITEAVRAELQKEFDAQKAALEAELEAKLKEGKTRSQAPIGPTSSGDTSAPVEIKVFSQYDRLTTAELCTRYELMRSYGRKPSERFLRVLETRVKALAKEKDVVEIKNGRPIEVPAIDWAAISPVNLNVDDIVVDEKVFAQKSSDSFWRPAGYDAPVDNVTPVGLQQLAYIAAKTNELNYSTYSGYGDEWVPTLMAATLWRDIRLSASVLSLFNNFDMPSQPYDLPTESTDPTFFNVAEAANEAQMILTGTPFGDSKIGTSKVTFTAGKLGGISYWSEEMSEDSIIAFEPQISTQYGVAMAHAIDSVLLNGDETTGSVNISQYGGAIAADSKYLMIDGLRHAALVTTTTDKLDIGGTLAFDDLVTLRSLMGPNGKYGMVPADVVYICDSGTYFKMLLLDQIVTVDKFGPAATVLNGQLGAIGGISLVVSEDLVLTDTSGYINNTPGNNTKGSILAVHRAGWRVGWRRRPRIRVIGLPGSDARYIVASARFDLQPYKAGFAAYGYNITV